MKRKQIINLWRYVLSQLKKQHEPVKTSEEAAIIRGTSLESGAKALLLKADKGFVLVVISAVLKFNNKLAKKILSTKNLRFAEMGEVKTLTGCLNGAVPPFGSIFGLKTYADNSLFTQGDYISFNAGLRTKSMILKTEDFKSVEDPQIEKFNI